jgi:hypothetical protein
MDSLITTKHILHLQEAKSLRTRNQQNVALGNLTANMATLWAQPCIITDVRTYISATASKRIVDTLEIFPHNFPMPQLSSTDRLIMAANKISNALKNPHPEVPFAHIGDDTIEALTKLEEIFKNKFQKVQTPGLPNEPANASENKIPAEFSHPILASPVRQQCQKRSQRISNAKDTTNAPLLPRVVTPVNTSGKAGAQIPLGDDSSPWGR